MKSKRDAKEKVYRDEILSKALEDGAGWGCYHFGNLKINKLAYKNTFLKSTKESNGEQYIVCSGKY